MIVFFVIVFWDSTFIMGVICLPDNHVITQDKICNQTVSHRSCTKLRVSL